VACDPDKQGRKLLLQIERQRMGSISLLYDNSFLVRVSNTTMAHGERIELSQSVLETNSPALEHCRIKIDPAAPSSAILAKGFGVAIAQGLSDLGSLLRPTSFYVPPIDRGYVAPHIHGFALCIHIGFGIRPPTT
jgi:hypothetical protein